MRLTIYHETVYRYDRLIQGLASQLYIQPMNNERQILESFRLKVDPGTELYRYTDRFGNPVHHFTIPRRLDGLRLAAQSEVLTTSHHWSFRPPRDFLLYEATSPTVRTPHHPEIREWVEGLTLGKTTPLAQVRVLTRAVKERFRYEAGVTTVKDTALDLIRQGAGVCQDFAHFLLAVLRLYRIPALYVSGYLVPDDMRPTATHAWVMAYVGATGADEWVGFDPVTGEESNDRYVWLAVGRDYDDVTPVRGVYQGPGRETMHVHVNADQ